MKHVFKKIVVFIFLIVPLAAYASGSDYRIKSRDVLQITVYGHPDLTYTIRVTETGMIMFPLLGNIKVEDLTITQAEEKIAGMLAKGIIVNPQVSIFIRQLKGRSVVVIGEVGKPGLYELKEETTSITDIISNCGGLTHNAGDAVSILREVDGKSYKIQISLLSLLKNGDLSQNVKLQDRDIVNVEASDRFYIYGEVNKPGLYKSEPRMTLIKAIILAGGYTNMAAINEIKVVRQKEGKEKTIKIDMDNGFLNNPDAIHNITLQDDDVVYVPKLGSFYIYGEVNKPGLYKMKTDLTILKAIYMAGGLTDRASTTFFGNMPDGIKVTRGKRDKDTTLDAKYGDLVQDEDVILVPKSLLK